MPGRAIRRILDSVSIMPWLLRHPSARLCPACRLTWESRAWFAKHRVCHDCLAETFV